MSRQHLFFNDEEGASTARRPRLTANTYVPQHSQTYQDIIMNNTMTIDRKKAPKVGERDSNPFGTMPRQSNKSAYAKLKSIGAFTSLYLMNKEASIAEEELTYLKAVEGGDLEQVQEILAANADSNDSDDDDEPDAGGKRKDMNGNGLPDGPGQNSKIKSAPVANLKPLMMQLNSTKLVNDKEKVKEIPVVLEMVEVEEKLPPRKHHPPVASKISSASLWQKGTSVASPLPVISVSSQHVTIRKQGEEALEPATSGHRRENVKFNKNCRDEWGRSSLYIAMIHHNIEMLELLLNYKVEIDECLYHAIDFGYYDIVELFMQHDNDTKQMITGEDSFYAPGLTPIQLAAHKNDYVMLKILYSHGYRIRSGTDKKSMSQKSYCGDACVKQSKTVLEKAWDTSNHQILYYRAIASPAYMVMMFNEGLENGTGKWDFLENIFMLYGKLKKKASNEPTVRSLYMPLAEQVEEFACDLLGEVRSSADLANLLRFDPPGQPRLISQRSYLTPVQRAIEVRMKRFVAHENSQLAITALRLGTLFESEHGWHTFFARIGLALLFPFLCIAFIIAPDSKIGRLLRNPILNMSCHMTSEFVFLLLMILRLVLLTESNCDCLGMTPRPIDYLILVFVVARIVNQLKKLREATFFQMITNVWTLNEMAASMLFSMVIALKIYDVVKYPSVGDCTTLPNGGTSANLTFSDDGEIVFVCDREKWAPKHAWPITMSEACLALIYLLIHIRAMEQLYTDRTFGPLQLSLDKMLLDTVRFLTIFSVTFLAFAFGMTQLYWAYGTPYNHLAILSPNMTELQLCSGEDTETTCMPVYSFILQSLLEQYWTLYGYGWRGEPPRATEIPHTNGNHGFTEIAGQIVSMLFHVWAVVVMLNMLVAMMSHSFDRVRINAELEWKFHRSGMWMKFIRKGVYPRPPPMNLIPSPRDLKSFYYFLTRKLPKCCTTPSPLRHNAKRETNSESATKENLKYRYAITNITKRYLRRFLLPDFRHDEIDQPVNRTGIARRASVATGDDSS